MKLLAAILIALSLLAAGCGDDEDDEPAGTTPAQTTQTDTGATTETAPAEPAQGSEEDVQAVEDVVKKWTFEGDCELMTDKFLEEQLLGLGDNRQERCDLFEKQHQKPQYSEDDMKISEVQVSGNKASLLVGSEIANVTSKYELVKTGDQWQIDSAELQ